MTHKVVMKLDKRVQKAIKQDIMIEKASGIRKINFPIRQISFKRKS